MFSSGPKLHVFGLLHHSHHQVPYTYTIAQLLILSSLPFHSSINKRLLPVLQKSINNQYESIDIFILFLLKPFIVQSCSVVSVQVPLPHWV
ncbi:hypothetical protein F4824DRAFT_456668 [Ustulina deusta]|nr:hypothetical protein F4824DRAFT_456668 [Ustulina deusta]